MTGQLNTQASSTMLRIKDLQAKLIKRPPISLKNEQELMSDQSLMSLSEGMELVAKYKEKGALETIVPFTIKEDILRLSALNVNISTTAGILVSCVKAGEDAIALEKAETFLAIKDLRDTLKDQGIKVQATEDDIKNAARASVRDTVVATADTRSAAEITKFAYYAIKDFVGILERAAGRIINAENDNVNIS